MFLISHRGNINGKTTYENKPDYIINTMNEGYDVEIDVWYIKNKWLLGHDEPQYEIYFDFLMNSSYWIHCKNIEALSELANMVGINCFFHNIDDAVLTSKNFLWTYPGKQLYSNSICVLPEITNIVDISACAGICSDFIGRFNI